MKRTAGLMLRCGGGKGEVGGKPAGPEIVFVVTQLYCDVFL